MSAGWVLAGVVLFALALVVAASVIAYREIPYAWPKPREAARTDASMEGDRW